MLSASTFQVTVISIYFVSPPNGPASTFSSNSIDLDQCSPSDLRISLQTVHGRGILNGVSAMTMQSQKRHGLSNDLPVQLSLLAVLAVILIAIAWQYVW
jgi:hypothetical protein